MENIITLASTKPTFKSKALTEATSAIFETVSKFNQTAAESRKKVAVILARVERNKSYSEDGFKSLADYAEKIGLDKSLAHKLENAGRLLDSENESVKDFAAAADYSKLAVIASAGEDTIAEAIESGELKPEMSQAEVKEWKSSKAAANADKPCPLFSVNIYEGSSILSHYDSISIESIPELDGFVRVGSFKTDSESFTFMYNPLSGVTLRYTANKVKREKKTSGGAVLNIKNLSDDQLAALIAEYNARAGK